MRLGRYLSLGSTTALLWAASGPAIAQKLGQATSTGEVSIWRVLGALVLCLTLAVAGAYALRHRLRGSGAPSLAKAFSSADRRLKLVETVRLSHQTDICLMRCDGADFVVAATAHGVVLLSKPLDHGAPPEPEATA
ncbi:flagellar biosynthetic protein FliO [Caulobacter radicis]|uniref:Flagellar biogenesis protein n=1 Tax=Caulobacter radicis TaxID=2172650 RepID=A0A2T9JGM9_9CAUL|nr:flagellar biosynthetic protein FliO [Caulobacter radicis]PVM82838.1 hypothetical protein DDF65_10940 [Caulobacter radicis]